MLQMATTLNEENVDELISLTQQLQCEDPVLELTIDNAQSRKVQDHILVGKLISDKRFSLNVIKTVLQKSWRIRSEFQVTAKRTNIFVFSFSHMVDLKYVLENRPWSINNQLLALREWPPDMPFEDLSFSETPIWAQIHGLPPNQLNSENAQIIGKFMGQFLDADLSQDGVLGFPHFLRVKISLAIDKPLPTGFQNKRGDGSLYWVQLRYEKLPDFCYKCGILGHLSKNCLQQEAPAMPEGHNVKKFSFGPWLKAKIPTKNPSILQNSQSIDSSHTTLVHKQLLQNKQHMMQNAFQQSQAHSEDTQLAANVTNTAQNKPLLVFAKPCPTLRNPPWV
ncbi:hypothetical protein GH714_031615 [Hevea brasiliensis]|uniref:CCHC-type domain-containing protein n=1 Tax=Hevea brasiliensis TaxID=3981 RepID=A0A6A6LE88_HEVBR|nr:hypothetical protein GH714_031615 [Hevea brasiliensis]